ncbi:hypothetical protein OG828_44425 [Streptomyces sp. NBC_00457]|uniref:hypothetical protein n=1 Tax=unclassified Streptomyces TaxID=2593676 RepID=UPI002E1A85DB|nr:MULTISPECIES: hypothetical protein [unclassified Streptomyces]
MALRTQPAKGRPVNYKARVAAVTEGIELRWAGGLPIPGLFGGDHGFALNPHDGGTWVIQPLKEWAEAKASAGAGR